MCGGALRAETGYDGWLRYERIDDKTAKDQYGALPAVVVALGDAYGTPGGDHYTNYRPGRYPIGISFEMVAGTTPAERVPPRAAVVYDTPNPAYFATGK